MWFGYYYGAAYRRPIAPGKTFTGTHAEANPYWVRSTKPVWQQKKHRYNTHALVVEKLHMNSAINSLLSQHTERCSGPVSCVRSSDPHRWPCRSRALHAKSSCTLVSFWKAFSREWKKTCMYDFCVVQITQISHRFSSVRPAYFEADVPFGNRRPTWLAAQGRGGGWNCCHRCTLCCFLADIFLLASAVKYVP